MRTASLPMYDADRAAVGAWWQAISSALRDEGIDRVPDSIAWPDDLDTHWRNPNLLLSQTCGLPLITVLNGDVQVVGAFHYTAPGCAGYRYRSELVARAVDVDAHVDAIERFRGRVAAVNSVDSHSGSNALRALVAPLAKGGNFFERWSITGSHRHSLAALQSGEADIAAIDCVTLAGLRRHAPELLRGLRVVGATAAAPGLPLITASSTTADEIEALRRALSTACSDPQWADVREALFIGGFEIVPPAAWNAIEEMRLSTRDLIR